MVMIKDQIYTGYTGSVDNLAVSVDSADQKIIVTNGSENNVQIYSTINDSLLATIAIPNIPLRAWLIQVAGLNEWWVTNQTNNTFTRVSATTNAILGTISTISGSYPEYMIVFSATEVYVDDYVTGGTGVVMIVNPTTSAYVSDISVQSGPGQMALDNNSSSAMYNMIAICNSSSNTISIINTATNTVTATLSITGLTSPTGIIYIPSQDAFYVCSETGKNLFKLVPTSSTTVTASIAMHNSINAIYFSYDWQHNYLIFESATAVGTPAYLQLFNLTNNTVISTTPLIGNAALNDGLVAWDGNNQKWWAIRNQISGQSGFGSLIIIH